MSVTHDTFVLERTYPVPPAGLRGLGRPGPEARVVPRTRRVAGRRAHARLPRGRNRDRGQRASREAR